ncbi:MAG TPA: hypothetical protein VHE53_01755 [Patescibacteria group bacterium]|nr:hypothetical protein [Patescibacteria group bacterium]
MKPILFAGILIFLFFESSLISLPIVFILCLITYFLYPEISTIIFVFFIGLILDTLRITPIGLSSLAIIASIGIVELIKNAIEFKDIKLITTFLFVASYIYARLFSYSPNILVYFLIFLFSFVIFSYFINSRILWRKEM